jgi:diacylglycerol kinase family enzyme
MSAFFLVYNRKSGGSDRLEEIKKAFAKHRLKVEYISISELNDKVSHAEGGVVVVAAGGDGTVSAVAGQLVGSEAKLGVVPVGTLNHFAKDLGLPMSIDEAVVVIARGKTMLVDTAKVNGQTFINNSSIGVYPDLVKVREKHAPRFGKWPAALWGLLVQLPAPRAYHYTLNAEGRLSSCYTPFIFVGNNSYQVEEAGIFDRANLTEGTLCIYVVKTKSRLRLVSMAVRSLLGAVEADPGFERFDTNKLKIDGHHRRRVDVALDGEVKTFDFPLQYSVNPRSLKIIIPWDL